MATQLTIIAYRMSDRIQSLEKRYGLALSSLVIALVLFVFALILVTPNVSIHPNSLGSDYQQLAEHPLAFSENSRVQYRILTPLLANVLHLRGAMYAYFPLLVAVLFIAGVYWHFRTSASPLFSVAVAGMVALNAPVLNSFAFVGFPDTLAYLLFFACLISNNLALQCAAFGLALFNHDNALFALPFLVYRPWTNEPVRKTAMRLVLFLVAFVPVILYRKYVDSHMTTAFTPGFYLNKESIADNLKCVARYAPLGIFETFRLFWFVIPVALYMQVRSRRWGDVAWLVLVVLLPFLQLVLAQDTSRFFAMAFPAILYSAKLLHTHYGDLVSRKMLWLLLAANLWVPVYFVWERHVDFNLPGPIFLLLKLIGIDGWKL